MPVISKPDWCRQCPGWSWSEYGPGQGFSSLEGYGGSGLFAVAEALGRHEEEDGLPLRRAGASGLVFRRALDELGIDSQTLTITNVVRCRPPNNELWGKPWTYSAISHCQHYLSGAIGQRQPTLFLALGDTPYTELVTDWSGSLSEVRGFVLPSRYGPPLIATYHPAYITRGAWHLYGAFKADIGRAYEFAVNGLPKLLETDYVLHPEISDVRAFLAAVLAHPEWPIAYDVETAFMLGEKEPDDWRLKRLVQLQFSVRPGHAIVLPWDGGPYSELAKAILATPNPKWGWNSARSDDIILAAHGCPIAGERHDLMLAWAHLQPDFTAKGDDDDRGNNDKGIPAKLMGLQSAASFYCPEVGPWKHLGSSNLQLYGAFDADYTQRCGLGIFRELANLGLLAGYREHKYELRFALDEISDHGLPVDRAKQAELRVYTLGELHRIQVGLHAEVPSEILTLHPENGYKALHSKVALVDPMVDEGEWQKMPLKAILSDYDPSQPPLVAAAGKVGYLKFREFETASPDPATISEYRTERRPCIERLYNPHGSSPNTKAYIRAMGYKMPTHILTGEDTTGKAELLKLAKETGDKVLEATYTWRDLAKTGRDYTTGKWVPGEDGRVHGTFRCGTTGSGQSTCTDPNLQQFPDHTGLAKRAKEAIRAEPGHVFVKVDMRGFHSRAIGWLARDPVYYQLADEDVHSFITAHYLNLPDAPYLMEMSPDERRAALKIIKAEHGHTRNYKVKRVVHGRQFNMGLKKLYQLHGADFDPPIEQAIQIIGEAKWYSLTPEKQVEAVNDLGRAEARRLYRLFDNLFPLVFVAYIDDVREQIYHRTKCRLATPFGHHRFFWGFDMEQAAAFRPSNCAHCHIQSALVRMRASGALRAFGACNFTHDALWLHPVERDLADCVQTVQAEFEAPSTVLVDNPLGPFQCNSDAEVGYHMAAMEAYTA